MTILDRIMLQKKEEVAIAQQKIPIAELKKAKHYSRNIFSLKENLLAGGSSGIIAEFKRRSPSKGWINEHAIVKQVTTGYVKAGVAGISVLTDQYFFGGSEDDILKARENKIPILRKDFIAHAYQVYETKALGADVMLLIAACLTAAEVKQLSLLAKEIGLEVLLELHSESETNHICHSIDMIGINNRDLKTFQVNIDRALKLAKSLPKEKIKIAESGIENAEEIIQFRNAGYKGFLMGESFMKTDDPALACKTMVKKIREENS